ncbi:MAG: Flp pilus assembly protein CpaB [Acidobacteriaceae bacterium]
MNRRLLTIFFVAFVIALSCTWWVVHRISAHEATPKQGPTTKVFAASRDIPLGAVITPADLTTMAIAGDLPKGAITKQENAVGRGVVSEIYQGEMITDSRLSGAGVGGGLAPTIPKGMRACAVKVDEVVGVAGFVIPGTRVDVLGSGTPPNAPAGNQQTQILLQNIQVLSAGTDIQKDATGKPQQVQVVTLLVTPEQAETLDLASNTLKIALALRNPMDTEIAKVPPTQMSAFFSAGAPPPAPKGPRRTAGPPLPKPQTYSIIINNGSKSSEQTYPISGGQH